MTINSLPAALKKRTPAMLALLLTLGFALLAVNRLDLGDNSFLTSLEWRWVDWKFQLRGARPGSNQIVIVGVDEKTLDQLGSIRAFQRNNWAKLVSKLGEARPRAIGFDITFQDPDVSDATNDKQFADAIRSAGSVVLGLQMPLEPAMGLKRAEQPLDEEMKNLINEKQIFAVTHHQVADPPEQFFLAKEKTFKPNLPVLTKAAASFGFVNFHVDDEGRLRYQPQMIEFGAGLFPSLDLQLIRQYTGSLLSPVANYDLSGKGYISDIQVANFSVPTDHFGRVMINYAGPRGTYQTVPMIDVIEGRVRNETFKDKIVLIGAPTPGLNDVVATPFDPALPGSELHANVIDNILHGQYLHRELAQGGFDIGFILLFGVVLGYLLPKLNTARSVLYTALVLAAFIAFNVWAFIQMAWVLSLIYPGLSLALTGSTLISYKYWTEERGKKRTKLAFKNYLDPHVIEQVMTNSDTLKLGGEKRELTVLFSDIPGFTSFSEKMAPSEVVHFLNQYFDKMVGLIFRNKGTLDKLIGDAVMCFWGHPVETKDHALRGVITALEMIKGVEDLRGVLVLPGGAKFEIGIGLNTGPMVVGNMGAQSRFSYTVMGDNVNLGSRLESLNKYYGTTIIISDSTYQAVRDMVLCRQLDTIQVKGKSQAVAIYEPLGVKPLEFERRKADRREPITIGKRIKKALVMLTHGERRREERRLGSERIMVKPEQEEIATMYEHALRLYRKGDFDGADMAFEHVSTLSPGDGPSRLMRTRIAKYRSEHSGDEAHFDPVYKFDAQA